MDELELVEKLKLRANVSYEEAKEALDASNNDILDAMIYLEKKGCVSNLTLEPAFPNVGGSTFDRDASSEYTGAEVKKSSKSGGGKGLLAKLWNKSKENYFVIERKSERLIKLPVWGFVLAICFIEVSLPLLLVGLFLDCRYSFEGADNLSEVNRIMNKCSNAAEAVKGELVVK